GFLIRNQASTPTSAGIPRRRLRPERSNSSATRRTRLRTGGRSPVLEEEKATARVRARESGGKMSTNNSDGRKTPLPFWGIRRFSRVPVL
ncbi:MAG: hypothetical protein BJ554DRAFT_5330, partial [Olpidium bornovanus]